MYTWGYIKENALTKLNLSEEAANQQGFLSAFPYHANEAMTQICSAIKPHEKSLQVEVLDRNEAWTKLTHEFGVYCNCQICEEEILDEDIDDYEKKQAFWTKWKTLFFVDKPITFPDDFIAFSDDMAEFKSVPISVAGQIVNTPVFTEVGDELLHYEGYNQVVCKQIGIYKIPYKARWFFFTKDLQNATIITAPADICDAIPSYIASQCFKLDDQARSAIYRNEFEAFKASIDDTSFKTQRTLTIAGGW